MPIVLVFLQKKTKLQTIRKIQKIAVTIFRVNATHFIAENIRISDHKDYRKKKEFYKSQICNEVCYYGKGIQY